MKLIVIVGPTAAGKSALGLLWGQRVGGEIVSGDSVQVYRELTIGSAKPSPEERRLVPHHLIDFLNPDESFTAARFQELARAAIAEIRGRNRQPIVVGGTGLYIRALLDPFAFAPQGSASIRDKWLEVARRQGTPALHHRLSQWDPASAARLHQNDTARLIRALEVYESTGRPLSEQRGYQEEVYPKLDQVVLVGLTAPRPVLYRRIDERCEAMVKDGLIQEVEAILKKGYAPRLKALRSIGYRHAVDYLYGKVNRSEMLRLFQRDTRRFAKRQLTWFRRDPRILWFDTEDMPIPRILNTLLSSCGE